LWRDGKNYPRKIMQTRKLLTAKPLTFAVTTPIPNH
jgi:hypothetical protein